MTKPPARTTTEQARIRRVQQQIAQRQAEAWARRPGTWMPATFKSYNPVTGVAVLSIEDGSEITATLGVDEPYRVGERREIRYTDRSTTLPAIEIGRRLRARALRGDDTGIHPDLAGKAPAGVVLTSGSQTVAAGTYQSFIDIRWDIITGTYNFPALDVQSFNIYYKESTAGGGAGWHRSALPLPPGGIHGTLNGGIVAGATSIAVLKRRTGEIWPVRGVVQIEGELVSYTGITDPDAGNTTSDVGLTLTGCTGVTATHAGSSGVIVRAMSYRVYGLTPGVSYDFKVAAVKADGARGPVEGPQSSVATIQATLDTTPPPAPASLTTTPKPGAVLLSWPGVPASDLKEYIIYRAQNAAGLNAVEMGRTTTTSFTYPMEQGSTAYFYVTGIDLSGNETSRTGVTYVAGYASYLSQTNYVRNSLFTFGLSSWLYTTNNYSNIGTVDFDTTTPPADLGNAKCGRVIYSASFPDMRLSQIIPTAPNDLIGPGASFAFQFRMRTSGSDASTVNDFPVRIVFLDSAWAQISTITILPPTPYTSAWQHIKYENHGQTVPANTAYIRLDFVNAVSGLSGRVTGVQFEPGQYCSAHVIFVQNTTQTHQWQNLLANTWVTNVAGWSSTTRYTGAEIATCPTNPVAGATCGLADYTVNKTFPRGQFITASVYVYIKAGYAGGAHLWLVATNFQSWFEIPSTWAQNTWHKVSLSHLLPVTYTSFTYRIDGDANLIFAAPKFEYGNAGTEYSIQAVDLESAQTITGSKTFTGGVDLTAATVTPPNGAWTPVLEGTTTVGSFDYTSTGFQLGRYSRLGNVIIAWCNVRIHAINAAAAGGLRISGLPVPAGAGTVTYYGSAIAFYNNMNMDASYTQLAAAAVGSYINIYELGDGLGVAFFPAANLVVGSQLVFTVMYEV